MEFKPLDGKKRRVKRNRSMRERKSEEVRQIFVEAWGINKTTEEILKELGRANTAQNAKWLTSRAKYLRQLGYDVPCRVVDGLTPTQRRDTGFAGFWNSIFRKKRTPVKIEPTKEIYGFLDFDLLKKITTEGRSTNELLDDFEMSRNTLLKRLSALEHQGYVRRYLKKYEGAGRGFLWKLSD